MEFWHPARMHLEADGRRVVIVVIVVIAELVILVVIVGIVEIVVIVVIVVIVIGVCRPNATPTVILSELRK